MYILSVLQINGLVLIIQPRSEMILVNINSPGHIIEHKLPWLVRLTGLDAISQ